VPRIPEGIIEQIAAANDIVEIIGSYFPLKRAGGMYKALCPFHRERTPSFSVNPQKQIFKCFGCGAGGSVFRFVMDYEKVDFITAVRKLAEKANISIPEAEMSGEDYQRADMRRRLLALHGEAADFFHTCLMRTAAGETAREYFKKRGLGADVAKSWKLGFSPDAWDSLLGHLQERGYSGEELDASGLFSRNDDSGRLYDRFRGRVMFPICNDTGEVIAFSGRVLSAEQSPAKYVNSPETMLFTKGAVLFGLNKSKRALIEKKQAIVCEGQIDLITAFENGVQNVIAPQGTAFTERQARILKRFVEEVVLCFDADAAGEKAAERSLPHLLGAGLLVRCAEMPPGEDPDSLIRSRGGAAFSEVIAQSLDFFDFQLDRQARKPDFATPRGKVLAARKLAEFISLIPDAVTREAVVNNTAIRLEISSDQLRTALKKPQEFARTEEGDALDATPLKPTKLDPAQQWLALIALRNTEARQSLLSRSWQRTLDDGTAGSALLAKILAADFRAEDVASVNAWLSTLAKEDEAALCSVLDLDMPREPEIIAEDCWHELERRDIIRRRQVAETRLRAPGLLFEEQARLHQQVLELHSQLAALPRPRPPKSDT
jgi:DNA primase